MGFFGVGAFPLGFSLARDATFAVEASTGLSLIFVVGQVVSFALTLISGGMEQELEPFYMNIEVTKFK